VSEVKAGACKMTTDFKRRKHGTPNQLNKPFPVFDGEIPERTKQLKRATAKKWNEEHPERFQTAKRRWYLKKKREEHGSSLRSEHSHEISGATPTERLFVSTNRTLTRYDEKKIGLFNSSKYGIVIRKRKPTHKEKAEAEGWVFLE
jgi:hypothetical protein